MASQKKIGIIVLIGILVVIVLIALFRDISLKNDFSVTKGHIYEFGSSRNSGSTMFFKFRFSVNRVIYTGNSGIPCARENKIHFQSWTNGKKVQVIYNKTNPNNNKILLTKDDYEKYGLSIPDEYKLQTELIDSICNRN